MLKVASLLVGASLASLTHAGVKSGGSFAPIADSDPGSGGQGNGNAGMLYVACGGQVGNSFAPIAGGQTGHSFAPLAIGEPGSGGQGNGSSDYGNGG
jgi:hypothetical protein